MIPMSYLKKYHSMVIADLKLNLHCTIDLKRYISGAPDTNKAEYNTTMSKITSKLLKMSYVNKVPSWFKIANDERVSPDEEFCKRGIKRAYYGRASHDEIYDTVRLACMAGRCKTSDARTYAETWFGLDCNAFVGNYQGISPNTGIAGYVAGLGSSGKIKGASEDVYMTRDLLPLPPVTAEGQIVSGTVLVTYRPYKETQYGHHLSHIALVNNFSKSGGKHKLEICEWGHEGPMTEHHSTQTITLEHEDFFGGKVPGDSAVNRFKGKKLFGFWDYNAKYKQNDLRLFFDASPWDDLGHRGWNMGTQYEQDE